MMNRSVIIQTSKGSNKQTKNVYKGRLGVWQSAGGGRSDGSAAKIHASFTLLGLAQCFRRDGRRLVIVLAPFHNGGPLTRGMSSKSQTRRKNKAFFNTASPLNRRNRSSIARNTGTGMVPQRLFRTAAGLHI
eukprot:scaffold1878_cov170-Amphora_coffeaeformis.AAC.3